VASAVELAVVAAADIAAAVVDPSKVSACSHLASKGHSEPMDHRLLLYVASEGD